MANRLSPWCKRVKIRMIERDVNVNQMAADLEMSRPYLSSVINGRVKSDPAVKKISDYLQISDDDSDLAY